MDYRHEAYDPPDSEHDEGLWQIHQSLDPGEKDAFQRAAAGIVPAERMEFHTDVTDGTNGDVTFAIRVYASSRDDAIDEARHLVRKIRLAAGLDADAPDPLGYVSPWWQAGSVARRIAKEAHDLHGQSRHELAVIRIQTACELWLAETVAQLLAESHPEVDAAKLVRRPMTPRDARLRALLHLLTGRQIDREPWWPAFVEHMKRRNAIVHDGIAIRRDDAFRSLEASVELQRWLLEVRGVDLDP